jgi:NAD(P)-dependent dehydrogenase (short-subunit alcohol dehydrogenase family)
VSCRFSLSPRSWCRRTDSSNSDKNDPKGLAADMHKLIDVNVIGNIHFYTAFVPLLLKGTVKKAICITSGMSDIEMVNSLAIDTGALYSISKAAMNLVTAKFHAEYKDQGVLFLGICPGMVEVGAFDYGACKNNFPSNNITSCSLESQHGLKLTTRLLQWPLTRWKDCNA